MKLLIIDDEKSIRLSLKINMKKLGVDVFTAESGEEGLEIMKKESPDIVIVDIKLPGINGIDVLKEIKRIKPSCIVIMITYLSDVKLAVKAMKMGAYDYFTKPFLLSEISNSIEETLKYAKTKVEINKENLDTEVKFIGQSPEIMRIKDNIKEIVSMNYNTCILLEGESGSGKEVIAKSIQRLKGNNVPFVSINCAAIPENLQESELFGYEKGAFSDAKNSKKGLIEKANKGVLFLDEIGDMDIALQAKMLRVLQEKKFRRIGGLEEISFNAIIISATNKDLQLEIKRGNFREDLFFRLNIIPICIPPLRKRKEDIIPLLQHFIENYNQALNKNIDSVSKKVVDTFKSYTWPGNVRELKNVIERIMIFKKDNKIKAEDIPKEILDDNIREENEYYNLEIVEERVIKKALDKNEWNITKTSEELGVSRITLRRKIEKYDLKNMDK
ncbi:sigma-54-dependent Fis family transcriptional regulator [Clostridium sp. D2Q-14]|uniref:sigma-54-dependent transcriptional regulator n=1 Tax=Anaeromonas gelatinilytica TaxID=2683194 RepID=UPI00193B5E46|nr:sigma-54 dependent transcriptional regulator [Anaeromonas gelatinilytica]MBS4534434.1 sigma-54-dependent Fis family transcriptional regulator [Anaeromonas gelatinilytica]